MEKTNSLYNITSKFIELFDNVEEGVITDEEAQEMGSQLALELQNKSISIIAYEKTLEAKEEAIKNEIERLKELKERVSKKIDKFKNYVKDNMETLELSKIETDIGTITVTKNPASVEIYDEALIPEGFKVEKVTVAVDKTAIKEALKSGQTVAGAKLVDDKTSLRIK